MQHGGRFQIVFGLSERQELLAGTFQQGLSGREVRRKSSGNLAVSKSMVTFAVRFSGICQRTGGIRDPSSGICLLGHPYHHGLVWI